MSVAMYGTFLAPDSIFDDYQINQDKEEGYIFFDSEYFWDNFKNDEYTEKIQSLCASFYDGKHEANGIEIDIKCGVIYSPKEYNFANDNIEFTVKFDKRKVLKFAKDNAVDFDKFLHENYTSYDGFHSFTANNFSAWLDDFKVNNDQSIGAVLTFIFKDEITDNNESFSHHCFENLYYSEFCDYTQHDSEVETIQKFVKEQYLIIDRLNLTPESFGGFELEILSFEDCIKIVNETFAEIENNTLTLFLSFN